ncbi:hypothetical protein PUR29_30695 [Methylobacterium ajmalii]|uniref:Uncharacterized protein n=1 Tax=Methylobacterium ajmalii TaxID=2738439 RepID=A0ABV0A216_9HYPH
MSRAIAAFGLAMLPVMAPVGALADGLARADLKPFNVTIRVFDPTKGIGSGQDYVPPVDSPDAEHAIASTTANAASFTTKTSGGKAIPVAYTCVRVEPR